MESKPKAKPRGKPFGKRNTVGKQFQPGNPGGPGRPRRQFAREYMDALVEAVPPEEWRKIIDRAVKDAIAGDARAREWLAKYLIGEDPIALHTMVEELERLKATIARIKELHAARQRQQHQRDQQPQSVNGQTATDETGRDRNDCGGDVEPLFPA